MQKFTRGAAEKFYTHLASSALALIFSLGGRVVKELKTGFSFGEQHDF